MAFVVKYVGSGTIKTIKKEFGSVFEKLIISMVSLGKYVSKYKMKLLFFISITSVIVWNYFTPFCCSFIILHINTIQCQSLFHQLLTIQLSTSHFYQTCLWSHSNVMYTPTICNTTFPIHHFRASPCHNHSSFITNAFAIISSYAFIVRSPRYLYLSNCEMLDKLCALLIAPSIPLLCTFIHICCCMCTFLRR